MVRLSVTLGAFAGLRTLGGLGSLGLQVTAAKGSVGGDYKECGKFKVLSFIFGVSVEIMS